MKNSVRCLLCTGFVPIVMAVVTTGCATKGFVRAQVATTNTKVSELETKTNEQAGKEQADISRVEERIATTDSKVAELSSSVQQANSTATQANQLAQQNQSAIAGNTNSLATLDKAMSYSLVAKGDVTFSFDKYKLGKDDQAGLDLLIQQVQSRPRAMFELIGFTDEVGSNDYNLMLGRRRAESVARYLVHQGVPLRSISIIGLGKEPVPANLLADVQAVDPNVTSADAHRLSRRVLIRIYTADASLSTLQKSASLQ